MFCIGKRTYCSCYATWLPCRTLMGIRNCSGISTEWLFIHCFRIELEFGVLVFVEGGKPENPEKNPRSRDENQRQTQPTCDAGSGNRTRAAAVGGERSHHCAIPAPLQGVLFKKQHDNINIEIVIIINNNNNNKINWMQSYRFYDIEKWSIIAVSHDHCILPKHEKF